MKKAILLPSLSLFAIGACYAQTQDKKEALMYQQAVPADVQKEEPVEMLIETKAAVVKMENEKSSISSYNQQEAVTPEEDDEIKYMQNVNRERETNDCIMQLETIEEQIQDITTKLNGVETAPVANEVKKAKKHELQSQKDELLKRKQLLNVKLETLETQNKK